MKYILFFIALIFSLTGYGQTTVTHDSTKVIVGDSAVITAFTRTTTMQSGSVTYTYPVTTVTFTQYKVPVGSNPPPNQPPKVSIGLVSPITLPVNSINLTGVASDADGTVTGYLWSKVSGPANFTIVTPTNATTSINGLIQGTYSFQLTVTDNGGATANATVSVTVNPAVVGPPDTSGIKLEGFGSQAVGGSQSSTVYHVTNLNASGAGSLFNGLGSNRTIVFDVSGTINARHDMTNVSYLTIDGTTAPYPGITISTKVADGMSVGGTSNHVIIKGITFTKCYNDGLNVVESANNVLITNCSAYGNGDGNIDLAAVTGSYITMQFCIIGNHDQSQQPGNQGTGGTLVTSKFVSVHHNLFYPISPNPNEGERFVFVHCNYSAVADPNCDERNNLIWQYGRANATGSGYGAASGYNAHFNAVGNYLKTTSTQAAPDGIDNSVDGTTSQDYSAGNVSGNGINFNTGSRYTNHAEFVIPAPYQVTMQDACTAAKLVLLKAGITQRDASGKRTAVEQSYINGVTTLTGCP